MFRRQFMAEWKRHERQENGAKEVILGMEEDEGDQFLMGLGGGDDDGDSYLEIKKRQEQKKDLKKVDHSLLNYEPITKNLYIETKEVSRLTDKEVADFKKNYGDIKVRGLKCPKPIQNWYQCGLPDKVLEVIEKKAFEKPFPI